LKLLKNIIFIITVLLLTSVGNAVKAISNRSFLQIAQQTDTTKKSKNNDKIEYTAKDSIRTDRKSGIMYLYGNAKVLYQDFELSADYIRYDSKNNIVFASGVKNKRDRYIGRPIFKMGSQASSIADSISYNTKSGKALVFGVFTEQEGGFFSGGQAKLQPDNEVHIKGQTFSTCNLPHPHFGIFISKGIATEKQIITGPVYLKIEDIPMPIGLPFAFFPKPNKKSSGFILPTPNQDATRGFSLNGLGYYQAFNDYLDGRITGNVFTNGSYDATFTSNYLKKYKYNGNISLNYSSLKGGGLEGTEGNRASKVFNIGWTHAQNANANPGTNFSATVNAGTSSYFRQTAGNQSYDIGQIAQNTMSSSISYGKVFGNGINFTGALRHSQETQNKTISITLPEISLSVPTFNIFDKKGRVEKAKWYQKIAVGYNMQAKNEVSTTEDLLFQKEVLNKFQNGVNHSIPVNLAFNLFQFFNFNANTTYNERWYLQTTTQKLIRNATGGETLQVDTVNGFKRSGEYSVGMSMSTKIYGTKQFKNFLGIKAIRHVITPNFNLSYKPDFAKESLGYYKNLEYWTDDIRPGRSEKLGIAYDNLGKPRKYSIFERSYLGGPSIGEQANLGFNIDNNIELKVKNRKDTANGGEKKIPIIQGLNISGSYNFIAERKKLTPLNFSGRSQFTDKLGFNFGGMLNPYQVKVDTVVNAATGLTTFQYSESDSYTFSQGKLPRLVSFNFSFDYSLNPDALKKRNQNMEDLRNQNTNRTQEQINELAAISSDPNAFVDFNIPWNFAFSYAFSYSNSLGIASSRSISNTLNFNGDFALTPKWKVQFNSGWDFRAKDFSYTSFAIYRDLHCWDLSASWIPFGTYASYSVTIKVKQAILQDLKLSKRKNYYTRY